MLSELPSFLTDGLHFDLKTAGNLCILPYFALFSSSILFGLLLNNLQRNKVLSIRGVRLTAQLIGFVGASLYLVLGSYLYTDKYATVLFLVFAQVSGML